MSICFECNRNLYKHINNIKKKEGDTIEQRFVKGGNKLEKYFEEYKINSLCCRTILTSHIPNEKYCYIPTDKR